jgi:hypothetical protein
MMFSREMGPVSPLRQPLRGAPTASGRTRASPAPLGGVEERGGGAAEEHAADDVEDLPLDGIVAPLDDGGWVALHVVGDAGAVEIGRTLVLQVGATTLVKGVVRCTPFDAAQYYRWVVRPKVR